MTLELRCKFLEKPHDFEEEIELTLSAKKKKNKRNKKTERGSQK